MLVRINWNWSLIFCCWKCKKWYSYSSKQLEVSLGREKKPKYMFTITPSNHVITFLSTNLQKWKLWSTQKPIHILTHKPTYTQTCLVTKPCPTLLWPKTPRLLCPWDSPGKNTGVGCHVLLQGIFPMQGSGLHLLHWQAGSLPLVPPNTDKCDVILWQTPVQSLGILWWWCFFSK